MFFITQTVIFSQYRDDNGDGIFDHVQSFSEFSNFNSPFNSGLTFQSFWTSGASTFTYCSDGVAGYFDGDSLLDVAAYGGGEKTLRIAEQFPGIPDSFVVKYEFTKTENGNFVSLVAGDTDGDGKIEIIIGDLSTLGRLYMFENDGNDTWVNLNTQATLTQPTTNPQIKSLLIADMNNNGKQEIIVFRGVSSPSLAGDVSLWEHSGASGINTYSKIHYYGVPSYFFGSSGIGDADNDGYPELYLSYGGLGSTAINIGWIEYNPDSSKFFRYTFASPINGLPSAYAVADYDNDGNKELVMTGNIYLKGAGIAVFRSNGLNTYQLIDTISIPADNNSLLTAEIKHLTGRNYPSVLIGSFNGRSYVFEYDGTGLVKQFEKTDYPSGAIRKIRWIDINGAEGFINAKQNSGTGIFLLKRDDIVPVEFISFTAFTVEGGVQLLWSTATETNNAGFEIQRSYESGKWQTAGYLNGAGTSVAANHYSFTDVPDEPGDYQYRLKQIDLDGSFSYSAISQVSVTKTGENVLIQNYPNPFRSSTNIVFTLKDQSPVIIKIYNSLGEEIQTLVNETRNAGKHQIQFDTERLTSGVYYYKITAGNYSDVKKMLINR